MPIHKAVQPIAGKGLVILHPYDRRYYNPYYNEWDLYFPSPTETELPLALHHALTGPTITNEPMD